MKYEIKQITQEQATELLNSVEKTGHYTPLGLFWHMAEGKDYDGVSQKVYVGIYNSSGHAWTEEFDEVADCLAWLRGEYELDEHEEGYMTYGTDVIIQTQSKQIDRLSEAKRKMVEYIRDYGFCGYTGEPWTNEKLKCFQCIDKGGCERYKILIDWG